MSPTGCPDLIAQFERNVAQRREHVAVIGPDRTLTYGQLAAVTNRLAHRLRALGIGRDARVGVSMRRGAAELVALLATAKAGAAYVPLAPNQPTARLRMIVDDAAPDVLLVTSDSPLSHGRAAHVLVLDDLDAVTAGVSDRPPEPTWSPDDLAYVMFTSGSTGRPKGVEVTRGAFANFLGSMAHTPGLRPDERLLAITTTAFDISGLELFGPLWVGATSIIADAETCQDARRLRRMLEQGGITMMQATPATWRLLLEAGWTGDGKLRMLCGGEAMSAALADRLLAAGGELWNMYGPTETTVWSSLERIRPGYDRITIGEPIDDTSLYVLDGEALARGGAEGEIAIGGAGLARGYRGRADLTAERFVTHIAGANGARLYRTGDLGRRLLDGRIEWLGRLDHQVKIRGNRVELGEIEAVLRAVPGVGEVLVVAVPRDDGDTELVAYWTGTATQAALLDAARAGLPSVMVPSAYVPLAAFPLNPNGKIERAALPKPRGAALERRAIVHPDTDTESLIAAAWRDVLGLAEVSVVDDFFTLGGTSALALSLLLRLERELGLAIPLPSFFADPTIRGMAVRIGEDVPGDAAIVVRLQRGPEGRAPLFCLFGLALYQDLARALRGNRTVIGIHVPVRYVPGRDERPRLEDIARRYREAIVAEQPHGPYDLLGLCFGGIVAYEVARQLEQGGAQVRHVAIVDAVLPNAVTVDGLARVRGQLRTLRAGLHDRQVLRQWLRRRADRLSRRVPVLAQLRSFAAGEFTKGPIELPIDGAEVELEVARFAEADNRVGAELLVVRATEHGLPQWMTLEPSHGWGDRGASVSVCDIPADHLGVMREPHVELLAREIAGWSS